MIYDTLVAEFAEEGKYYGGAMELPRRVALSAYDDTAVMQAVKDTNKPVEPLLRPTSVLTLAERIAEVHKQEPINVPEETSQTVVIRASGNDMVDEEPEVQHVFPIKRNHSRARTFSFFAKTDKRHEMRAA
jgi:hypothetical protein